MLEEIKALEKHDKRILAAMVMFSRHRVSRTIEELVWAAEDYLNHGRDRVCGECEKNYKRCFVNVSGKTIQSGTLVEIPTDVVQPEKGTAACDSFKFKVKNCHNCEYHNHISVAESRHPYPHVASVSWYSSGCHKTHGPAFAEKTSDDWCDKWKWHTTGFFDYSWEGQHDDRVIADALAFEAIRNARDGEVVAVDNPGDTREFFQFQNKAMRRGAAERHFRDMEQVVWPSPYNADPGTEGDCGTCEHRINSTKRTNYACKLDKTCEFKYAPGYKCEKHAI